MKCPIHHLPLEVARFDENDQPDAWLCLKCIGNGLLATGEVGLIAFIWTKKEVPLSPSPTAPALTLKGAIPEEANPSTPATHSPPPL